MNKRLVNAACWTIGSVFSVLNMSRNEDTLAWSVITMLFVWNAVRQFNLYRDEKEQDNG